MTDLFKKKREEKRERRKAEISEMHYDELTSLEYQNDLEIDRLKRKIQEAHSFLYGKYCESQVKELEWENEIIKNRLNIG